MSECPICDRLQAETFGSPGCHRDRTQRALDVPPSSHVGWIETQYTRDAAARECQDHAVDWRARARAAEFQLRCAIPPSENGKSPRYWAVDGGPTWWTVASSSARALYNVIKAELDIGTTDDIDELSVKELTPEEAKAVRVHDGGDLTMLVMGDVICTEWP